MKRNLLFLFFAVISYSVFAQGVIIKGNVSDEAGESLPGVNIVIKGTLNGTASNIDGDYQIRVVEKNAVLVFSFIGYQATEVPVQTETQINVVLSPDVETLDEVIITAQAIGQKNAIRQQINSNTIKNVVASDRLQENPDANATEAIGRLPGISLIRGGGEGTGLVIRGLAPGYSKVTLNGVEMPTTGDDRSTNISGISQYMLQGVEVYKVLTADMEGDAVAGTVNLTLKETAKGFQSQVMAQMGYNDMNSYWKNYKLNGDISNRFFHNKLGVSLSLNAERVMRSTQTMSAGYSSGNTTDKIDILISNIGLNAIERINYKRSAMLSLDYKVHPTTTLSFYSLYTYNSADVESQSKSYGTEGNGSVNYNISDNKNGKNHIWQNTISGRTQLNFMDVDYGVSYSYNKNDNPKSRGWSMNYLKLPNTGLQFTEELRKQDPSELIPLYNDDVEKFVETIEIGNIATSNSLTEDKNLTAYLDFKIPFKIGDAITGHIKTGGRYRQKNRFKDVTSGSQPLVNNQFAGPEITKRLDWLVVSPGQDITAVGFPEGEINSFLNGQYDFGSTFSIDRFNDLSNAWEETIQYWKDYAAANGGWGATLPDGSNLPPHEKKDYTYNMSASIMSDQNIVEDYYSTYLLTEINFGRWAMFMPGIRYEKTKATMDGYSASQPYNSPPLSESMAGVDTSASRSDEFFLPMIHLRITPHKNFYIHAAYTQNLRRPSFNDISPNTFSQVNQNPPHSYTTKSPQLKAEHWTNYDLQFTFHGEKAGLVSLGGFYKKVENQIWGRSWVRLPGEPLVGFFGDKDQVTVSRPENHPNTIFLKGMEAEIQTSFWYLPKPFSYFTTSLNYTYTESETKYPISWLEQTTIIPPGGGRPTVKTNRIDTTMTDRMTNSPKHIVNASLGFNKDGLNIWLSYQYNGDILTGKRLNKSAVFQNGEMDGIKKSFQRWDLQVSYKFSKKLDGFEIIGNFANLNDFMETQNLRGDVRPTYLENYGWTADLGFRYRF